MTNEKLKMRDLIKIFPDSTVWQIVNINSDQFKAYEVNSLKTFKTFKISDLGILKVGKIEPWPQHFFR